MKGRVLIVAGSDSGGGAGIQADIKTVSAFGGFAMTAITAVTAQNTRGVSAVSLMSPAFVADQMRAVLDDLGTDVIKLGMLGNAEIMDAVCDILASYADIPCVIDPVMIATSGSRLMSEDGEAAFRRLYKYCYLLTPNVPELEVLSGHVITAAETMRHAAVALRERQKIPYLLAKGGHLPGSCVVDLLISDGAEAAFHDAKIDTLHTHGTGCTLASAVATLLAQGIDVRTAVQQGRAYVRQAILQAPPWGTGCARPMNHSPQREG